MENDNNSTIINIDNTTRVNPVFVGLLYMSCEICGIVIYSIFLYAFCTNLVQQFNERAHYFLVIHLAVADVGFLLTDLFVYVPYMLFDRIIFVEWIRSV
jgi:hypothetical protein